MVLAEKSSRTAIFRWNSLKPADPRPSECPQIYDTSGSMRNNYRASNRVESKN
jgi:hypothetical protein